jgi:hypothetical protein
MKTKMNKTEQANFKMRYEAETKILEDVTTLLGEMLTKYYHTLEENDENQYRMLHLGEILSDVLWKEESDLENRTTEYLDITKPIYK